MADHPQQPEGESGLDADFLRLVREMSDEAEASKKEGRQLGLGMSDDEGTAYEQPDLAAADLQNPNESHRIYYAVQRLLKGNLPPGKENEELRRYVYDEKNLYINRGMDLNEYGVRGSDGRMAYIPHLKQALKIVKEWVAAGGSAFDVFMEFRTLNERLGYHKKGTKADGKTTRQPSSLTDPLAPNEEGGGSASTVTPSSHDDVSEAE